MLLGCLSRSNMRCIRMSTSVHELLPVLQSMKLHHKQPVSGCFHVVGFEHTLTTLCLTKRTPWAREFRGIADPARGTRATRRSRPSADTYFVRGKIDYMFPATREGLTWWMCIVVFVGRSVPTGAAQSARNCSCCNWT